MPANRKVSVAWQIVFTFIPIVNFWAFYRVKKLQKYVLYVMAPSILLAITLLAYPLSYEMSFSQDFWAADKKVISEMQFATYVIGNIIGWALQGLSIYLVIIWSRQHNKQFDQPTTQAKQP
ncbi:MAG TPA: hypothetical protein VGQ13_06960 [Nitrososphaera sp.]|jgi:hypothetical protein|nr:hypothetical protein [Nitrososphaera sp.]